MRAVMLIRSASFHSASPIGSGPDSPLRRVRSSVLLPVRAKIGCISPVAAPLRRARSDTDLVVSERIEVSGWAPPPIAEEEEEEEMEMELAGGGKGKGKKLSGGGRGGGGDENGRIGDYYEEMIRSDPGNALLLRNYGRFLHDVKGDVKGAEECYGRAILESPGDGDVLSLYGSLVWKAHGDEERASSYFERAVEASPDDCYVLGSYANFLWDSEE